MCTLEDEEPQTAWPQVGTTVNVKFMERVQSLRLKQLLLELLSTSKTAKTLDAFATMLEPRNVVHFFKCMESSCDFSTDDDDLFLVHLAAHQECTFLCSYCGLNISNEAHMVKHIVTDHGWRRFQCPLCFYRSRTVSHIKVHALSVHPSHKVHWYLCKEISPLVQRPVRKEEVAARSFLCSTSSNCQFRSLSKQRFMEHLLQNHADSKLYMCHICSDREVTPESLLGHYAKAHGFFEFQCLCCDFGHDDPWEVMQHMAELHADEPFKILVRSGMSPKFFSKVEQLPVTEIPDFVVQPEPQDCISASSFLAHKSSDQEAVDVCGKISPVGPLNDVISLYCNLGSCGMHYTSIPDFMAHISEKHPTDSEFFCPKCDRLNGASMNQLFDHLVKIHSCLRQCLYKSCYFAGKDQESIDKHILESHQTFEAVDDDFLDLYSCHAPELVSNAFKEEAMATECINTVEHPKCLGEPRFKMTQTDVVSKPSVMKENATLNCSARKLSEDTESINVERHACALCGRLNLKPTEYVQHMSLHHGMKYFCGHCNKSYKVTSTLINHTMKHHPEELLSVKTFQEGNLTDGNLNNDQCQKGTPQRPTAKRQKSPVPNVSASTEKKSRTHLKASSRKESQKSTFQDSSEMPLSLQQHARSKNGAGSDILPRHAPPVSVEDTDFGVQEHTTQQLGRPSEEKDKNAEVDYLEDSDSNDVIIPAPTKKRFCRRIVSDSEDESSDEEKNVVPSSLSDVRVYLIDVGVKVSYGDLAMGMNLQPKVVLRRLGVPKVM